jgi:raffinose/stachyose/melibiose transport system permease protein
MNKKKLKSTMFVMPAFLLHLAIVTIPALTLLYYAFTKWSGLGLGEFNGLANFRRMVFEDTVFHKALLNNLLYLSVFVTLPFIAGLGMALLVKNAGKAQMLYRTVYFLPYVISAVIAGKIFLVFYSPYQGIGKLFAYLGISSLANAAIIGNEHLALFAVAFVDYWHWWGFVMALFLAALHQVDSALYESASIEGANKLQQFWHVTIPQILPTIITLMMITTIGSFLTFDWIWAMTQGGPAGSTEIASTWIYKRVFVGYEAGYGSMLSLTICLVCVLIYFFFRALQKRGWDI